ADELAELGWRAQKWCTSQIGNPGSHFWVIEGGADLLVEPVDDFHRHVLWRNDAVPLARFISGDNFTYGRDIRRAVEARRGRDRERSKFIGLDVFNCRRKRTEYNFDLSTKQIRQCRSHPPIRHMGHADTRHHLEQLTRH